MPIFECEICNEEYSHENENHIPKALKCGHSICQHCAAQLIKDSTILCPFCRETTEVRGGNVKNLQKNFGLVQAMEASKEVVSNNLAPKCNSNNIADYVCADPSTRTAEENKGDIDKLLEFLEKSGRHMEAYHFLKHKFDSGKKSIQLVQYIISVCNNCVPFSKETILTFCFDAPRFLEYANIDNCQNCFDGEIAMFTSTFYLTSKFNMSDEERKMQLIQCKKFIDAWHTFSSHSTLLLMFRGMLGTEMQQLQSNGSLKKSSNVSSEKLPELCKIAETLLLRGFKREANPYVQQILEMEPQNREQQEWYNKVIAVLPEELRYNSLN